VKAEQLVSMAWSATWGRKEHCADVQMAKKWLKLNLETGVGHLEHEEEH
jgi:hypothetical protein